MDVALSLRARSAHRVHPDAVLGLEVVVEISVAVILSVVAEDGDGAVVRVRGGKGLGLLNVLLRGLSQLAAPVVALSCLAVLGPGHRHGHGGEEDHLATGGEGAGKGREASEKRGGRRGGKGRGTLLICRCLHLWNIPLSLSNFRLQQWFSCKFSLMQIHHLFVQLRNKKSESGPVWD